MPKKIVKSIDLFHVRDPILVKCEKGELVIM